MKLLEKIVIAIGVIIVIPATILVAVAVFAEVSGHNLKNINSYTTSRVLLSPDMDDTVSDNTVSSNDSAVLQDSASDSATASASDNEVDISTDNTDNEGYSDMPVEDLYKELYGE